MPESSSSPYIPGSTRSFRTTKIKRPEPGTAPGSIVADPTAPQPILRVVAYDSHRCAEATTTDPDSIQEYLEAWPVTWVSVNGLGNAEIVRRVGEIFRCHRLALEDVISVHQRPKVDEYEEHLFIVVRVPDATDGCGTRQVTLFLGESFVLTFEEATQTRFDRVRKRLRDGRGHLRRAGPDYLAYAILDAAIDCYFPVVESYGEQLEKLEEEIMARRHDEELVTRIHDARRELLTLRRLVRPLRDAVKLLLDDELPFVQGRPASTCATVSTIRVSSAISSTPTWPWPAHSSTSTSRSRTTA